MHAWYGWKNETILNISKCEKKLKNTASCIKMLSPEKWKSAKSKASVQTLIEWMLLNSSQYFTENTHHTLKDQFYSVLLCHIVLGRLSVYCQPSWEYTVWFSGGKNPTSWMNKAV